MTDVHTPEQRSFNMSRIKAKNTLPELLVRKFLHRNGFRYKLHDKTLPGKPDIVLPKYKTVIFIHGCFWHGHEGCKYYSTPKTRTEWWRQKIEKNILNDAKAIKSLQEKNWNIIIIWECELKKKTAEETLTLIKESIKKKQ